jgi:hypothetical protein
LRIVSTQLDAPLEWLAPKIPRGSVTNPIGLVAPSAVFVTSWRSFEERELGISGPPKAGPEIPISVRAGNSKAVSRHPNFVIF